MQPSGPGTDHRVVIDIPLLPQPLASGTSADTSAEEGQQWNGSGRNNSSDEPSIAVCVGDSHKAWWWGGGSLSPPNAPTRSAKQQQPRPSSTADLAAEDDVAAARDESCTNEHNSASQQCRALVGRDSKTGGDGKVQDDQVDHSKKTQELDLETLGRGDSEDGIESSRVDDAAAADTTNTGQPYSHDSVAESVCEGSNYSA